jgi:hypothetical protein
MTLSVHDNLLVSYKVQCGKRIITLHTEYQVDGKPTEFTDVVFEGVQAYHFENDAFGNIIFEVTDIPTEQFLDRYGAELSEMNRMAGVPGNWVKSLDSAPAYLREQGIKGFELASTLGLSGWVLAKELSITSASSPTS